MINRRRWRWAVHGLTRRRCTVKIVRTVIGVLLRSRNGSWCARRWKWYSTDRQSTRRLLVVVLVMLVLLVLCRSVNRHRWWSHAGCVD